jgi:hypothetical protein
MMARSGWRELTGREGLNHLDKLQAVAVPERDYGLPTVI